MTLMPVRGWFGISWLSPTDEWHLRRHHGHELDIGIERQAGHVQDCAHHLRDVDSRLDLDVPVRLHHAFDHALRHFGGREWADMEPLLTIRPPRGTWLFMSFIASWVQRNAPVRLAPTTVLHCSYVRSSSGTGGAPRPALLKRRSSRPNASAVCANNALTDRGSATSA